MFSGIDDTPELAEFSDDFIKTEFIDYITELRQLTNDIDVLDTKLQHIEEDEKSLEIVLNDYELKAEIDAIKLKFKEKHKIDTFREELNVMYTKRRRMVDNIKSLLSLEDTYSLVCPICFERTVNTFLSGCGHTFCAICIHANTKRSCPLCRNLYSCENVKSLIFSS
jgi:rubrerythrin